MIENELVELLKQGQFIEINEKIFYDYHNNLEEAEILDWGLDIANYWMKNEKEIQSAESPITVWDKFLEKIYSKSITPPRQLIDAASFHIMKKIYARVNLTPVNPLDKNPFSVKMGVARSLLGIGKNEAAFSFLVSLVKHYPKQSEPWGILGKMYFSEKKIEKALLCYREAFFMNPSVLNLWDVNSDFIEKILYYYKKNYNKTGKMPELKNLLQWIGISGITGGFFKIKRELSLQETSEMDKRIQVFENKYNRSKKKEDLLNLLRLNLFKIDYYLAQNKPELIKENLKALEILDPVIYQKLKI
ncbi:MAG TPA: hypothetical protein DHW82_00185 [Spirochaetia bacterium]|nr:MAG: hypothetical protein A2Y41_11060 [Spirochaetes bacterium GWB1_36_13]HCL55419.1 hypothetical protein [Spirochaetia bacterium]